MKTKVTVVLLALLVAGYPAVGQQDEPNELKLLRAHNERLKAALADSQKRIQTIESRLDELATAVGKLRWEASMLKAGVAAAVADSGRVHALDIRVVPGDWGGAQLADIQKVCESSAGELWKHFPDRKLPPIIVEHGNNGPIVLYKKGPRGEHIVRLDVEGNHWSQFAYQFSHEFCHILTNYHPRESKKNKWLVESLCETASLYAMRQMAETWKPSPPFPNWRSYAPHLRQYADNARVKKALRIAPGATLGQWYRENADALRKKGDQRDKNKVPASAMLAMLEANPTDWQAVGAMNLSLPDKGDTFEAFLADWLARTPDKHKKFVKKVADLFEITIPAKAAGK